MKLSQLAKPYKELIALSRLVWTVGIPLDSTSPVLHPDGRTVGLRISNADDSRHIALYAGRLRQKITDDEFEAEWDTLTDTYTKSSEAEKDDIYHQSHCCGHVIETILILKAHGITNAENFKAHCNYCNGVVEIDVKTLDLTHQDPPCEFFVGVKKAFSTPVSSSLPN